MVGRRIVRQVIYAGLSGCKHVTTPFYCHQIPNDKEESTSRLLSREIGRDCNTAFNDRLLLFGDVARSLGWFTLFIVLSLRTNRPINTKTEANLPSCPTIVSNHISVNEKRK